MQTIKDIIAKKYYIYPWSTKIDRDAKPSSIDMLGVTVDDYVVVQFMGRIKRKNGCSPSSVWLLYNPKTSHSICMEGKKIRKLLRQTIDTQ